MKILNQKQIGQKIARLAMEILEQNHKEKELILAGINNNGMTFAVLLKAELERVSEVKIELTKVSLNPAKPVKDEVSIGMNLSDLKNKVIIIVDDVANTGRTLFYAFKPLMEIIPKKVQVAVLVDRKHKSFPVEVDYVGLSLATTLRENIEVDIRNVEEFGVYLN